tara:strand:+ start:12101 stop:13183 length:1083 start_codon:yes stop_codon:yes gene_type:complete
MTFYNKKEEVIEVELTSFGKTMLAKGKLKPSYYAFFDEDIIYDPEYGASSSETADERIRNQTPRSRVQYNYSSVEDVKSMREEIIPTTDGESVRQVLVQEQRRRNVFPPIGTSANSTAYHPSWKAYMLQGELDSSSPDITMDDSTINIPQMELATRTFTSKAIRGSDFNSSLYGYTFPDGSSVTLKEDENSEFLLFLLEENASSDSENFSIEFYEVEEQSGKEFLTPLSFPKKFEKDRIVDGIMLDNEYIPELDPSEDPTLVGYYFDVEVDSEIDPAILTKAMQSGRFADIRDLESFANSARFKDGDLERLTAGNSATDIYGLSLSDIAGMNEEALRSAEERAQSQENLYDEEDNTNGCD